MIDLNNQQLQQRIKMITVRDKEYEARRAQLQKWLSWTFGNLHRASNEITFFYLVWTPLVIFWSVIITWSIPTGVVKSSWLRG